MFRVSFETQSWLTTVALSQREFRRKGSKHTDVDTLASSLQRIWGKVLQVAAPGILDKSFLSGDRMTLDENYMSLLAASLHLPGLNSPTGFLWLSALSFPGQ